MSLLEDIKKLESLFEQVKETTSYLVVEPKPLESTELSRELGVPDWDPQGYLPDDFSRDEKAIKQNRDWILEAHEPTCTKDPPFDTDTYKRIQKWMQEARPAGGQSAWVAYATQELERTGARRAMPAGFKEYRSFLTEKDTIYVAAPPQ